MYFAPTKQPIHAAQTKRVADSLQSKQMDQSVLMAPSPQANGAADSLIPSDEDRSKQPRRLVVRLDLRKIHASKKVENKVEKRDTHSKPLVSTRLLRQRPDPSPSQEQQRRVMPMLSVLAKLAQKRDPPIPNLSKQDISVTGDDSAIKPPVDPNDLPDEFFCVECRARIHPAKPNPAGLFKQLLDNMDRMNPKAFALPLDIRTYFRGVVTNSDGEYSDAMDYKPTPKRHSTNTGTNYSTEDDPLHLRDANGQFKACFRCNKTSLGRQIIRCDHCPLYWHLDCLSPPLAHPPPSTRKWMCPNHADHVTPLARNDGDIEVMSDGPDFDERRILLDNGREVNTTNIIYRVPEHSIKIGFLQKCREIRQQKPQQQHRPPCQQQEWRRRTSIANVSGPDDEDMHEDEEQATQQKESQGDARAAEFRRLVEVATLEAQDPGASELLSALVPSSSSSLSTASTVAHAMVVQDAVLKRLKTKQEQDEYLQFRAFQRMVREQGKESVVRRLVAEHETEKAEKALRGLLEMRNSGPC
ncbi:hypothetical protein BGZ73_008871 [Actinomortierella ambigua]|nr:hypothetical protein BGZ73_008871 [Actinomortierella ambigua]